MVNRHTHWNKGQKLHNTNPGKTERQQEDRQTNRVTDNGTDTRAIYGRWRRCASRILDSWFVASHGIWNRFLSSPGARLPSTNKYMTNKQMARPAERRYKRGREEARARPDLAAGSTTGEADDDKRRG